MATPMISTAFGDLLNPDFQVIFADQYKQLPDMIPTLYNMEPTNGRNNMTWSSVGTLPDFAEFAGAVTYSSQSQGYDTTLTPLEFTNGIQVERKLFDDDQYNIINSRPKGLAVSAQRTRQKFGARIFNNAFSIDTYFYNNTEAKALCSDTHTTTSGASTASGFGNLVTTQLSAVAVASARIKMVNFRDDQGGRVALSPDQIMGPPDLYEVAYEIIASAGKVDVATNNRNVHEGKYDFIEWNYLTDTNNWFLMDSTMRTMGLQWTDRIPVEFAMVEDFDTLVAKWRAYFRCGNAWVDWRWVLGALVS